MHCAAVSREVDRRIEMRPAMFRHAQRIGRAKPAPRCLTEGQLFELELNKA